jgi:hypothetical protein
MSMLATYKAILKGDRLEWREEKPETLPPDRELAVIVTVLDEATSPGSSSGRGARMADALERLAKAGGVSGIDNPLEWERDSRRERPLPGRD